MINYAFSLIIELHGHSRGLACVQFNDNTIVSGSNDKAVRVWNASTGECIHILTGHTELVRSLALSNSIIVSSSYDGSIKVWDLHSGKLLLDLPKAHESWVFHVIIEYDRIISSSQDKTVTEWRLIEKSDAEALAPVFAAFEF